MPMILGITGRRGVGKSKVADRLVEAHGFQRIHPFNGGKAACRGYFSHIGIDEKTAWRMTDGDLKDVSSPYLPDNQTPRFFMEKLGAFMPRELGPSWTIGEELRLAMEARPDARLIVESIVYEADVIRNMGGAILRVTRDGAEDIMAHDSDAAVAAIKEDLTFRNDYATFPKMHADLDALVEEHPLFAEEDVLEM